MYNHNTDSRPGAHISPLICQLNGLCMQHVIRWPQCHSSNWQVTQFSTDGLREGENRRRRCVVFGKKVSDSDEEMMKGNFSQ